MAKNQFLGTDSRKARRKKRLDDKFKNNYDDIKDNELKEELKKGATLLSYSED